jgi:hypothetical protein
MLIGRHIRMLQSGGQVSDYIDARALVPRFPKANVLLEDREYNTDRFYETLLDMGLNPVSSVEKAERT